MDKDKSRAQLARMMAMKGLARKGAKGMTDKTPMPRRRGSAGMTEKTPMPRRRGSAGMTEKTPMPYRGMARGIRKDLKNK